MARFTSSGHVILSGQGLAGLHAGWSELNQTVTGDLHALWERNLAVRGQLSGGGQTGHGQKWEAGYLVARTNATVAVEKALGRPHSKPEPVPAAGTKERQGYDAGKAAAAVAVLGITPD